MCFYSQHHDHLIVSSTAFVAKYNHSWVDFICYVLLVTELRSWRRHLKFLVLAKIASQSKLWCESCPLIRSLTHWNVHSGFSRSWARNISQQTSQLEHMSSNPGLFHSICNTSCCSHHLNFFLERHPTTFGSHSVSSRSFTLTFFSAFAVWHKSTVSWVRLFCFRGISGTDGNTQFQGKGATLGNICRSTSWIDWAGQICWQIINKTEIKCSASWEGRVQPSVAGVLVLIGRFQNPMMSCWSLLHIRKFPLKIKGWKRQEIYLWLVSAIMTWNLEQRREVDLSNDTKLDLLFARLRAVVKGQTMCFSPQNKFKTTRQTLISTLYWHSWRH